MRRARDERVKDERERREKLEMTTGCTDGGLKEVPLDARRFSFWVRATIRSTVSGMTAGKRPVASKSERAEVKEMGSGVKEKMEYRRLMDVG